MNDSRMPCFLQWLVAGCMVAGVFSAPLASAAILGPYSPDSSTLHLWHLDETGTTAVDSVATGGTNLTASGGATLGNSSYAGFGGAVSTLDGGQNQFGTTFSDAVLTPRGVGNPIAFTYADASGAFTFEALVHIEFDPAKNLGTTANGGNGRNQQCQIITCEANGTGSRVFQFRLDPIGTASPLNLGQPMLEFIRGPGTQSIWVPIPTNGPNAIVSNNWYHVAVTYNGVPNTVSNLNLYWTLMDPSRTSANLIGSANLTANLSPVASATTDFTIGNSGRNPSGSTANPLLANFLGLIDEVRLSKVARTANQMQFVNPLTITAQPQNATAAPGETVVFSLRATTDFAPLSYQWRSNGVNLVDGGDISGAATATLQLANVQFAYAADYDCVVGNSRTPVPDSVTSAAASLTVRTPLDLAWRGTINSTWDTSTANWWETSSGIEAPFTTGDRVTFDDAGSAASLVNLSETIMPKSLTINATASYTLTGNGKLSGASGLTKLNAGTLTVNTTNDYTGPTYLGGGTLSVASLANGSLPSAIGAASSAAGNLVFDGGALAYTGPSTAIDRGATLNSGGGMINVAASSSTLALGGAIAGASGGGLTKAGDGTLLLTSANPYNGPTTIAAGTLQLGSSGTLGSGPVLNSGTLAFYFPGAVNFGNPIAGPGSVFNSGPGNLTLGGTNSYSGLTIATAGTLTLANGRALGNSPLLFVSSTTGGALGGTRVALNAGVTIDETVGLSLPSNASGDVRSILFANGPSSWNGPISLNGNGTIAFSGTTGGLTIGGNISSPTFMGLLQLRVGSGYSGVIAGTVTLASEDSTVQINDGGTWTISSAGNSWGLSQIANGTLRLGQDYALPIDTTVELGKAGSGTLDLAGFNQQIAGLIVAGTASSQVIGNSSTLYDSTLTFSSSGSSVYGGRMVDALGGGSRRVALEIAGGTLAFTAPQTYSGQTLVRAGTLALNGVGTIDRSASLVVAAGATLDASGRADGKLTLAAGQILQGDGTVRGNLVVGSGSTLSPGMGVGVLTNLGPVSLASGGNAVIEVSDATGGPGVGYDSLYVLRGVDVQATNSTPFRIQLVSVGDRGAAHFDNNTSYAWTIATATEGVTGYAPDALVLDTASFSNDLAGGSFILSPNTLVVNFTNNHPPVANVVTYVRPKDATLQISIADLATNWSDPDGDAVALVSVAPDSTNGVGNVSSDGTNIFYTAGAGGNVPDAISYTIRDVRSSYRPGDTVRTTVGTILVAMVPDDTTPTLSSQTAPAMLVSSLSLAQATQIVTSAGTAGATYLQCLTNFERYAESIWHTASYAGAPADAGYWGDGGSSGNGGIRGNSGVAVAYAVLVMALPDAPQVTNRLARLRQALNYNAATHVTGATRCVNGSSWGWSSASSTDWQTPEWSASMGLACLLVQSQLPAATVQAVQRVIASEATHRAGIAPASGYVSDTKAEENAWDGNVLALGAAWLSANPSAAQWLQAAKQYLVNSYTVADPAGDPLAGWVTTDTLFPSYALQNHGFYHPTYEMVAGMSLGDSLLMARLANPSVAAQLQPFAEHNAMQVWTNNLVNMLMDSSDFAYPAGQDWELHDYEQNSYLAWMAAHFNAPEARWADNWMSQLVLYRQGVNGDGSFVGPSGGGFYREAVEARRTAIAWLHWANADYPTGMASAPATPNLAHYPDVEIIGHRSAFGFFSLSYGSRILATLEPAAVSIPTNAFLTTPRLPGMIGMGALGTPASAQLVSYQTNANGFDAELTLQYGTNGSTEVFIKSTGESVGIVEVPRPAPGFKAAAAGSFAVGIENDPLCGGTRLLEWTGSAVTVTNRSGFRQNVSNNWVCVAGRYGMAAGPSGYFSYQAPTTYNRSGAAEDTLQFMPADVLAPRYAVWFPGKTAAETASNASAVSWSVLGSAALLTFPGPGGMPQQMSIPLLANGTWSADISGNWSDTNNWSGGLVASGPGYTADLSALNLTADRTVTLDSSRSIGTLKLGESLGSQNWILNASGASVLTLDAGADIPAAIVVNQNTAAILAPLAGANGFIKSGPGALILGGANSLAGTLYVDSGSTVANDGALRIISSAALAGMDAISIRNSSAGASTFQLDGTAGDLVVAQNITAACRASSIPSLQNIAGRNVLAGNLYMQTGGSNVVAQSDSGTLVLAGSLQYIGNLAGGRAFNFYGAGDTVVSGSILAATNGAVIGVGKSGSGTLTLGGANTYTGPTALNAGALLVNGSLANGPVTVGGGVLGGTGTLNGPVTVQAAGQLQPGSSGSLGTLTINNTLNLAGTTLLALNRTNRPNSSQVLGLSSLTCGGTLRVVNEGPALQIGDVFQLFAADRYLNGFDALVLPPLAPSLAWNTVNLMQNGTLSVEQMPVVTIPPGSQVVECSSNATFTVTAIGSSPLAYQWSLDGMPVPGATNASFTLNNVHGAGSAYGLSVQVINPYGSASASAALSVQDTLAPVLTLNGANPLFIERASAYNEPGATATDACAGPVPVTSNGLVNTAIVGTNTITYTAEDGSGHTSQLSRTVIVRDTTPPVVAYAFTNLLLSAGSNCQAVLPDLTGTNYILATDGGSSAGLTITQNPTNGTLLALGTNQVVLTVSDNSHNLAWSTNQVVVADTTPPVITVLASNPMTVECHTTFTDPGAAALDGCSGVVSLTTNNPVLSDAPGSYTVTYVAIDTVGNTATNTRTVNVVDTTAPVVTLNGKSILTVECHGGFVDPGASATDTCAGSLKVTVAGSVNPNVVGSYTLTYSAMDPAGNIGTAVRTIKVVDTTPPVVVWSFGLLTLSAGSNCTASLPDLTGTNYILATDSGSSAGLTITQSPTNGAALALGTNQVVLTVSDSSHNLAWSTNCIVVADTTPPVITVLGPNPINVRLRSNFVDPGATALDNCSGLVSLRTNNLVDIKDAGTYTIEYVASDALGNTATNTRIVTVVDTPGPLIVWSFNTLIIKAAPNSIVQMPDVTGTNYLLVDYITTTPLPTIQSRTNGSVLARGTNQVILQVSGMLGSKPRTVYSTNWVVVTDTAAPVSAAPQIQALLPATRLAPPVLKDGTCQLSFSGPTGQTYQVLAGQDLAQPLSGWTVLTNGVFSAGAETFTDTSATNGSKRFYRLVSP